MYYPDRGNVALQMAGQLQCIGFVSTDSIKSLSQTDTHAYKHHYIHKSAKIGCIGKNQRAPAFTNFSVFTALCFLGTCECFREEKYIKMKDQNQGWKPMP